VYTILLLAHASWLVANLHSQIRCSPMRPGWWQNCEAILRCRCAAQGIAAESPQESAWALSEDLKRKARFLARSAKNAPNF
jgi:hypothetical protein